MNGAQFVLLDQTRPKTEVTYNNGMPDGRAPRRFPRCRQQRRAATHTALHRPPPPSPSRQQSNRHRTSERPTTKDYEANAAKFVHRVRLDLKDAPKESVPIGRAGEPGQRVGQAGVQPRIQPSQRRPERSIQNPFLDGRRAVRQRQAVGLSESCYVCCTPTASKFMTSFSGWCLATAFVPAGIEFSISRGCRSVLILPRKVFHRWGKPGSDKRIRSRRRRRRLRVHSFTHTHTHTAVSGCHRLPSERP